MKYPHQHKWRQKNPLADWAHSATRSAIRRGLLVRPDRCELCGTKGKLDAHHSDGYLQPLTGIMFVCRRCHKAEHQRLRKAGRRS